MKNVKESMVMLALADFVGKSESEIKAHLIAAYEATQAEVDRFNILIAYEYEDGYEGCADFLLEDKTTGDLYEVHASHCSCYGYEGQFNPELTNVQYLLSDKGGYFYRDRDEVKQWLRENLLTTSV